MVRHAGLDFEACPFENLFLILEKERNHKGLSPANKVDDATW